MNKGWKRALMIRQDRAFTDGARNDFDKRFRTTTIPDDNYTQAVAAYKGVRALDACAIRRRFDEK